MIEAKRPEEDPFNLDGIYLQNATLASFNLWPSFTNSEDDGKGIGYPRMCTRI